MKLVTALVTMIVVGLGAIGLFPHKDQAAPKIEPPTQSIPQNQEKLPRGQTIEVSQNQQTFLVHLVEIPRAASVELVPNFKDKENSKALVERNNCNLAINGGFYQKDATPLGLFYTSGVQFKPGIKSNLVTGFFWEDHGGNRMMGKNPPESLDNLDFILQTGPLFTTANPAVSIVNDEHARRSLLVLDKTDKLYAATIVGKENSFSGPPLGSLPGLLAKSEVQTKLPITTILNLDGGSASFFYVREGVEEFMLSELVPVGSVICVKSD